jgi:hypothetical protein
MKYFNLETIQVKINFDTQFAGACPGAAERRAETLRSA